MHRTWLAVPLLVLGLACGGLLGPPDCETLHAAGGLRQTYDIEGAGASQARDVLEARLRAAGDACSAARVEGGQLVVDWVGETDPQLLRDLGQPGHLRIRPTVSDARAKELMAALPPLPSDATQRAAWLASARASLPQDVGVGIEPPDLGRSARPHLMPRDAGLIDPKVATTEVVTDDHGGIRLLVTLDGAHASAFARLTEQSRNRPLVVELDGVILVAPVVMERLDGGEFSIDPGASAADPEAWCHDLAMVLAGPLPNALVLVSENTFGGE